MTDAQFLTLAGLLTEIRDLMTLALMGQAEDEPQGCQHPEDNRVSFATPNRPEHWICNLCKFEHHGVVHN